MTILQCFYFIWIRKIFLIHFIWFHTCSDVRGGSFLITVYLLCFTLTVHATSLPHKNSYAFLWDQVGDIVFCGIQFIIAHLGRYSVFCHICILCIVQKNLNCSIWTQNSAFLKHYLSSVWFLKKCLTSLLIRFFSIAKGSSDIIKFKKK